MGKPSGRVCDGRLIVDFVAKELGLAYLRAYLDSLGFGSFNNGANFATGGSSTRKGGKADVPKAEGFSKALYTIDIGQNDLAYGFQYTTERETRAAIPNILDIFSTAVQDLLDVYLSTTNTMLRSGSLDKNGCVILLNDITQDFNRKLKPKLTQLKANLISAAFTYVDAFTAKYNPINSAKAQGFVDPLDFCCCGIRALFGFIMLSILNC
ncbi:hypothetical protein MKX01_019714 [Papaver californicum]|nr:hypothetical protein MKX01_019714 [Papaver californicum]